MQDIIRDKQEGSSDADIFDTARKHFTIAISACQEERENCLSDRRFVNVKGAQWEGWLGDQFIEKPKLEVNKIQISCMKIINEYLNNTIDTNFISDSNQSDKLCDACNSIMRADESDSNANESFDNGLWESTTGGMGGWRLTTEYIDDEDEDDEAQRIKYVPIVDADKSIFFTHSVRADKSDAKRCFVINKMDREDYIEEFDDDPATWGDNVISVPNFDWFDDNTVTLVEYYNKEETKDIVYFYQGLAGEDDIKKCYKSDYKEDKDLKAYLKELRQLGYKKLKEKKIKKTRVHKYLLGGSCILEDCGYIAGKSIPIIPVFGKRCYVDGIERIEGHVRLARDVQIIKNVQLSKLVDIASYSSIEKPILTPQQIVGHTELWAKDNIKNNPYLLINQTLDVNGNPMPAAPLSYTKPPSIPPATVGLIQASEQDMQDILGNPEQANEVNQNTSGVAIEMINSRLDMMTYNYMSNMAKARKRTAEIWLEMAKEIYVEEGRRLKTMDKEDNIAYFTINELYADDNMSVMRNDLSKAKLDVKVTIGATSASKRSATVRALSQMLPLIQDPQTQQVVSNLILMNMEGEGLEEARKYFRKTLVSMGVVEPNEEEQAELEQQAQNQQPDPQAQYLQAVTEQSKAAAAKDIAGTQKILADVEKTKADTAKTISDIDNSNINTQISVVDTVLQHLQQEQINSANAEQIPANAQPKAAVPLQ